MRQPTYVPSWIVLPLSSITDDFVVFHDTRAAYDHALDAEQSCVRIAETTWDQWIDGLDRVFRIDAVGECSTQIR